METSSPPSAHIHANIYKLYAYAFFHNLIFAYVIERLFALERGLNVQQMVYLEVIYAAITIGLEVPTGALSDRWSRKNVMILSAVCDCFEVFMLIFALSAVCAVIGGALASGTVNAMFYDSLKQYGQEARFERALAINRIADYAGASIAALSGAVLAERFGLTFNYWISLVGVGMALLIAFTLTEPAVKSEQADAQYWEHIRDAARFLQSRKTLRFVMFYGLLIASVWMYVDEYWQIYAERLHVPISWFGVILMAFVLTSGLGGLIASHLTTRLNYPALFSTLLILFTATLFALSTFRRFWALGIALVLYIIQGALEPLLMGYLHHRTASRHRATVESFYNLTLRLVSIVIGLTFGYVASATSIFGGFRFLAVVALIYALYYLPMQFRRFKTAD